MAGYGLVRRMWLTRLSRPASERPIYRHCLRSPPRRVIELGLGTLARTERLLGLLRATVTGDPVHYVGLDRFEGRQPDDPPGVTLKQAHQRLHGMARVQLVPGNVDSALSRLCNHLGSFDLVLISADNDARHLERSWFFIQRLITPQSTVFFDARMGGGGGWSVISKARVDEWAARTVLRRAA